MGFVSERLWFLLLPRRLVNFSETVLEQSETLLQFGTECLTVRGTGASRKPSCL
ncbi:MAG: hypothetical protein QG636_703 [Patescibacteria group bacterium]|nr:hypothetical protein [Patescibacteria group bacterium]